MYIRGGARGYHCSYGTLIDNVAAPDQRLWGVHILWGGLPSVPPPSKDGESPSITNVPFSMGGGGRYSFMVIMHHIGV